MSEQQSESTKETSSTPSQGSAESSQSSRSPWLALWGMGVATYIALGPMLSFLRQAVTEQSWWALGAAGVLALFPFAAFWPTSIRDVTGLVEAPGKLIATVKSALASKK